MQIGILLVAVHMRCNDSGTRYAMKNRFHAHVKDDARYMHSRTTSFVSFPSFRFHRFHRFVSFRFVSIVSFRFVSFRVAISFRVVGYHVFPEVTISALRNLG